jgi:hypothetical protein
LLQGQKTIIATRVEAKLFKPLQQAKAKSIDRSNQARRRMVLQKEEFNQNLIYEHKKQKS